LAAFFAGDNFNMQPRHRQRLRGVIGTLKSSHWPSPSRCSPADASASSCNGSFYQNGLGGVPKDEREAARLYKLAADQSNAWAQANLGFFYETGLGGLPKDLVFRKQTGQVAIREVVSVGDAEPCVCVGPRLIVILVGF